MTNKERLLTRFNDFQRKAWIPQTKPEEGSLTNSKLSGTPYLQKNEQWPVCKQCGYPLQLFLQLNISELPSAFYDRIGFTEGLVQLFYCTNPEELDNGFEAFAPSTLVRILFPKEKGKKVPLPAIENYFPPKKIVDWKALKELPHIEELWELGVELKEEEERQLEEFELTLEGDKLGGWPYWIQGPYYPSCKKCGRKMRMLMQLDSKDNLPYMFGDAGIGHIFQCEKHKKIFAFNWSCY
ncbi:MAG: DUF1963 domain-containing protein [Candidatus Heimdallarchaeota archaeon]|nr:DUF1963 domain-containing protein [Candidatus Heimdallarchaeota archaeon]